MLEQLKKHYGDLAGAQYGYSCKENALKNTALAINANIFAEIFYLDEMGHVYISDGKRCYSRGLTWRDDRYPELTLKQISQRGGANITRELLNAGAIDLSSWPFGLILNNLENKIPGLMNSIYEYLYA
jgi:hypothetical protein